MAFDAFVSYSHAADGQLAPALQQAIQRFAKPWYRARAALLALDPASGICCDYVGRITTAKDFETITMYRLRDA